MQRYQFHELHIGNASLRSQGWDSVQRSHSLEIAVAFGFSVYFHPMLLGQSHGPRNGQDTGVKTDGHLSQSPWNALLRPRVDGPLQLEINRRGQALRFHGGPFRLA
jgi:hypothetical protein